MLIRCTCFAGEIVYATLSLSTHNRSSKHRVALTSGHRDAPAVQLSRLRIRHAAQHVVYGREIAQPGRQEGVAPAEGQGQVVAGAERDDRHPRRRVQLQLKSAG